MHLATSNDYIPFDPIVKLSCSLFKSSLFFIFPTILLSTKRVLLWPTVEWSMKLCRLSNGCRLVDETKRVDERKLPSVPASVRYHDGELTWVSVGIIIGRIMGGFRLRGSWDTQQRQWQRGGQPRHRRSRDTPGRGRQTAYRCFTRFSTLHCRSMNVSAPVHRSRWWSSFNASICGLSVNVCVCVCLRVNVAVYVCTCVEDVENKFHVNVYPREAMFVCRNRMKNPTRIRSIFFDLLILCGIDVTSRWTDCAGLCIYGTPRRPETFRFNSVTWRENIRLLQKFYFIRFLLIRFPLISFVL